MGVKEKSWFLCFVSGVSLASLCLSLVCIAHLVFVQRHVCDCVTSAENPIASSAHNNNGNSPGNRQEGKHKIEAHTSNDEPTEAVNRKERKRRNVVPGNNVGNQYYSATAYQLQRQLLMLETRVRYMQEEMVKRATAGPRGSAGSAGRPGRNGLDGRPGMDGPMGLPGRDGGNGKNGVSGPPGASGPPGVNGLTGSQGYRGVKGDKGIMGLKGNQGLPGPKGSQGPSGMNGENGEPGVSGRFGRKGEKGDNGDTTCYVTKRGRRYPKPCYLAAYNEEQEDEQEDQPPRSAGVVYHRWGRTTCPSGGARAIYSGQAAATTHGKGRTGGSGFKCLPSKPWYFGQRSPSDVLRNVSHRASRETNLQATYYYLSCAVCLVKKRSVQVMLPARKECYRDWHREYDGFLGVQVNRRDHKELICIDREAQGIFRLPDYVQAVRADCDTFSCPPYTESERLPCVVCTM